MAQTIKISIVEELDECGFMKIWEELTRVNSV